MTRIRYIKTSYPNIIRSMRRYVGQQGGIYMVFIDTEKLTYKVKNVKRGTIIRSTEKDGKKPPKNLYTVKIQAKKALESVGVKLERELRGLK